MNCICGVRDCVIPFGHCHCGCGGKTKIALKDHRHHGYVAGLPRVYVSGHNSRTGKSHPLVSALPFKIEGVYCRLIPLTQNYWAIVDAEDYARIAIYKWQALRTQDGRICAARSVSQPYKTVVYMHHEVLPLVSGRVVDHANRIAFDNRRKNLRYATVLQNCQNRGRSAINTSGFKGVSFHADTGKWRATIRVNRRLLSLGLHFTLEDAARAYDRAALQHFGEFACLNFNFQQF